MTIDKEEGSMLRGAFDVGSAVPRAPSMMDFDAQRYMAEVEAFDFTDAQKVELLRTIWSIMRTCVELGFQFDVCGQTFGAAPRALLDHVEWPDTDTPHAAPAGERKLTD